MTVAKEEFGEILPIEGYTLVSEKYHVKDRITRGWNAGDRSSTANTSNTHASQPRTAHTHASKDAILHTFTLMNESMFDKNEFGKKLMDILKEYEKDSELEVFARKMYELWGFLPYCFRDEKPFTYLFGADDHLSYGNRAECQNELRQAFHFYEASSEDQEAAT